MIVGFREFEGNFSRLESRVGVVLVSPDGVRYECVKRSDYGTQWRIVGDDGEDKNGLAVLNLNDGQGDPAFGEPLVVEVED